MICNGDVSATLCCQHTDGSTDCIITGSNEVTHLLPRSMLKIPLSSWGRRLPH